MPSSPVAEHHKKGPWLPTTWSLGGKNEKSVDIPITAVFMSLYMISAGWHMTIFQLNRRRGHKFLFNGVLFGFSMARITTCILRIASISVPANIELAIAAAIFLAIGVLIIMLVNLIWSQRILRAFQPTIGWHRATSIVFTALYAIIGFTLIILIVSTVQNFYTQRPRTHFIDRSLGLYGQTLLAIIGTLPILIVLLSLAIPRHSRPEKFGGGRMRVKVVVLLTGASLVAIGAWYRCGTSWAPLVPRSQPLPGYFSKPCFYIFYFGVEIMTVFFYAIMRVDLRFHVPNGAKGPGSYEQSGHATSSSEALQKEPDMSMPEMAHVV